MRTHHSEESIIFICSKCDFSTDRKDTLVKHQMLKHKIVDRVFAILDETLDSNNPSLKCFDCKKTFKSMIEIENHMLLKSCEDEEENICKTCGKRFTLRYNLLQHIRDVHENPQKFKCSLCEKTYSHKSSLTKHSKKCTK